MNECQNRFPRKNLAFHVGVFREARFSSFKSSWEARKNLACVLRLLVFRHSGNRHVKWDHRSVFRCCTGCGCICSLPVLACLLAYFERTRTKTIVNKREGRTEINAKSRSYIWISAWTLRIIFRLACVQTSGGVGTPASVCLSWVVKLDKSVICQHLFDCQRKKKQK